MAAGWGDRPCPANATPDEWLRDCKSEMYKRGFPFASWVVRERMFGLCAECALQFSCERPTPENAEELFGRGVLHVTPAG